jgi:hypothetical protein
VTRKPSSFVPRRTQAAARRADMESMDLRRADGTLWTWGWALPRLLGVMLVGMFVFRVVLDLSWAGTLLAIVGSLSGAALFWVTFAWVGRNGPIRLPKGSVRARVLASAVSHDKVDVRCTGCGWRGPMSVLVRTRDHENRLELECPECGYAVGHQILAAPTAS